MSSVCALARALERVPTRTTRPTTRLLQRPSPTRRARHEHSLGERLQRGEQLRSRGGAFGGRHSPPGRACLVEEVADALACRRRRLFDWPRGDARCNDGHWSQIRSWAVVRNLSMDSAGVAWYRRRVSRVTSRRRSGFQRVLMPRGGSVLARFQTAQFPCWWCVAAMWLRRSDRTDSTRRRRYLRR